MRKIVIILIAIIISLYSLSGFQSQECGFGFGNNRLEVMQYCPIATIDISPITTINLFTDIMTGIVIWFVLSLAIVVLALNRRADSVLVLMNNIVRRTNAEYSALCLWIRQFGTGLVCSNYL